MPAVFGGDKESIVVGISLDALRDENEALKAQVDALTQMVGLTLSLMRKWTAVNEADVAALCDFAALSADDSAADAIGRVRVLALGVQGAAPHASPPARIRAN